MQAKTLGELRSGGYQSESVREEMRRNLLARIVAGETLLPGLVGYEETVEPELENAILAGHHVVLLGERGQGKSRILRSLVGLLDEWVPAIDGSPLHDDPLAPISPEGRALVAELGDATPILWIHRDDRYGEKLATPDVTMADLIGEVDPVKIAEGRYLADETAIHFGLIPRANRGLFAINELPDLAEKVQVGLFNLMEERDVQVKGFRVRLPLDVVIVASANPEDYTSRGRIITPLKDRFDAQIRTHYPATTAQEIEILEQEVSLPESAGHPVRVPEFIKEILGNLTFEARGSSEINQASGVSVRVSINNFETVLANAWKRAIRLGESEIVPRVSDLPCIFASTAGKIELEYSSEDLREADVIRRLLGRATRSAFDRVVEIGSLDSMVEYFEGGWGVEISDRMPSAEYMEGIRAVPGFHDAIVALGPFESPGLMAAAAEFLLEGLHLHGRLNKEQEGTRFVYRA